MQLSSARPQKKNNRGPASAAAAQIVQAALREDCNVGELGRLAQADPAFALRVLSVVNSPAFPLARKVSDVGQAASLLGIRGVRNLALNLIVSDMVPKGEDGQVLLANCLRRALAARSLAKTLGRRDPDSYFTVGLFLEAAILSLASEDLAKAAEIARCPAPHRVVRERAAGAESHATTGAKLATEYHLPEDTVLAIEHHHDEVAPEHEVAHVAWLAERVAGVFEGGDLAKNRQDAQAAAEQAGVPKEAFAALLEELPKEVGEAAAAFNRDVGPQPDLESLMVDANRGLFEMNQQYEEVLRRLEALIREKEELTEELQEANHQLKMLASTDQLTALPNRRAFNEALERDLARADRDETPLSLVVIDVDKFKVFNDTWGHAIGDAVLRVVGQVLKNTLRTGDVPARYGGEEFVCILPKTEGRGAVIVADRLRKVLEKTPIDGPQGPLHVTASFGVATVRGPECKEKSKTIFERADTALYEAKETGRNRVVLAPDEE